VDHVHINPGMGQVALSKLTTTVLLLVIRL